jgi:hypothetical protein
LIPTIAALSIQYTFLVGNIKFNLSFLANLDITSFNLLFALTQPANITVLTHFCLAASIIFHAITSVTAFSNSKLISF